MAMTEDEAGINVRHSKYIIVESRSACDQCNGVTAVLAFALPVGYESLNVDDSESDLPGGTWEPSGFAAVLSYVEYLPEGIINRVKAVTSHYRFEPTAGLWRNS